MVLSCALLHNAGLVMQWRGGLWAAVPDAGAQHVSSLVFLTDVQDMFY